MIKILTGWITTSLFVVAQQMSMYMFVVLLTLSKQINKIKENDQESIKEPKRIVENECEVFF
jgi:hypothetical protein